jgi:hypothetical protein
LVVVVVGSSRRIEDRFQTQRKFQTAKIVGLWKECCSGAVIGSCAGRLFHKCGRGGYQCLTAVVVVEVVTKNVELPKKIAGTKKNINKKKNGGAQSGEVAIYIVCSFVVTSGYIRSCFSLFLILLHIEG